MHAQRPSQWHCCPDPHNANKEKLQLGTEVDAMCASASHLSQLNLQVPVSGFET